MPRMCVLIDAAAVDLTVELNRSATAAALWSALPLESPAQTWGAEIYFSVPLSCPLDDAQATVPCGAVGYWPPGNAVCLFFGEQPVSPVNIIGMLEGDANLLKVVQEGQMVRLEPLAD